MNVLVLGYGSIGSRHARILKELGYRVAVVSRRSIDFPFVYTSINNALKKQSFQYAVIANKTAEHYQTLIELAQNDFQGLVLVEKPLYERGHESFPNQFKQCYVGYNLRFHPLIQQLRKFLLKEKILSVQTYVGQYLPTWRPGTDYRNSYSSQKSAGGGVLRDLSHEIDYLLWILGKWDKVVGLGGKYSGLEIDSEDVFSLLLQTKRCPVVSLQMNYLDRVPRREIIVNTEDHSLKVDLMNGFIDIDGCRKEATVNRDYTYVRQHQAVLSNDADSLCNIEQAYEITKLIEAIEKSVQLQGWVKNE